jgi:hypothetical protein
MREYEYEGKNAARLVWKKLFVCGRSRDSKISARPVTERIATVQYR